MPHPPPRREDRATPPPSPEAPFDKLRVRVQERGEGLGVGGEVTMPVYEYLCQACQNRVGIRQSYAEYGVKKVACPLCGSKDLKRLINRVRIAKSEDQRLEAM